MSRLALTGAAPAPPAPSTGAAKSPITYRDTATSSDTATLTWGTTQAAHGQAYTLLGDPAGPNWRGQYELVMTGTKLTVSFASGIVPSFMVYVDGDLAMDTVTGTQPGQQNVEITWPSAATRTVRLDTRCVAVTGIDCDGTIEATPAPQWRIAVEGDSYIEGNGAYGARSIPQQIGARLGNASVASYGLGGTGWRNRAPRDHFSAQWRLDQIAAWQPHIVVVYGSWNDGQGDGADFPSYVETAWYRIVTMPSSPHMITIGAADVAGPGHISPVDDIVKATLTGRVRHLGHATPRTWLTDSDVDTTSHPTITGQETWGRHIAQTIVDLQPKEA